MHLNAYPTDSLAKEYKDVRQVKAGDAIDEACALVIGWRYSNGRAYKETATYTQSKPWTPSQSIRQAWTLIDEMVDADLTVSIATNKSGASCYVVDDDTGDLVCDTRAKTSEHAICRAFLITYGTKQLYVTREDIEKSTLERIPF